jgi:hypothetical protein
MTTRHPVEGDGCRVNIFSLLMRMPGEGHGLRCPIPDTVVFERNCPRSWFFYDNDSKEVRRRAGRDLQATTIIAEFSRTAPGHDVCATLTYVNKAVESDTGDPVVSVLYLTPEELSTLLTTSSPSVKQEAVLQKYVTPAEKNECVIQVSWGPRMCVVRRRMNRRQLTDKPKVSAEKHVTFDGPDRYSLEVSTAKDTVNDITLLCGAIVEHLLRSSRLHVASMTLYFKLDAAGRPRLLWCSSIRMDGHWFQGSANIKFLSTQLEGTHGQDDTDSLVLANKLQERLERAMLAAAPAISPSRKGSPGSRPQSPPSAVPSLSLERSGDGTPSLPRVMAALASSWFTVTEEVEEEHRVLREREAAARVLVEDALYAAVSHFQGPDPGDYVVRLPMELGQCLGDDKAQSATQVAKLMHAIGLQESATGELVIPAAGPGRDCDLVPPVGSMGSIASKWLDQHFAARLQKILNKALPHLVLAATRKALAM